MEAADKIYPPMKPRRAKPHKDRSLKILKIISTLKHACECSDPACSRLDCDSMKGMVVHSKVCNRKPRSGCHLCRQLIALCRYHAKRSRDCESVQCVVPFCGEIKFLFHKKKAGGKQTGVAAQSRGGWEAPRVAATEGAEGQASWGLVGGSAEQPEPTVAPNFDPNLMQTSARSYETTILPQPQQAMSQSHDDNQSPTVQRREQLRLLLHANKCRKKQPQNGSWVCRVPNCNTMKDVLKHILQCQVLTGCPAPHCVSSKKVINHWQQCVNVECQFCAPLKHQTINTLQPQNPQPMNLTASTSQNNNCRPCVRPVSSSSLLQTPVTNVAANSQQSDDSFGATNATASSVNKEWHRSVTVALRNHLVHKIAQSFEPPAGEHSGGWRHQLAARKIEDETYRLANSRSEYYHLIAARIYALQRESEINIVRNLCTLESPNAATANSVPSVPNMDSTVLVPVPKINIYHHNCFPVVHNLQSYSKDGRYIPQSTEAMPGSSGMSATAAEPRQQYVERLINYHPEMMEVFRRQREQREYRERLRAVCQVPPFLTQDSDLQGRTTYNGGEGPPNTN